MVSIEMDLCCYYFFFHGRRRIDYGGHLSELCCLSIHDRSMVDKQEDGAVQMVGDSLSLACLRISFRVSKYVQSRYGVDEESPAVEAWQLLHATFYKQPDASETDELDTDFGVSWKYQTFYELFFSGFVSALWERSSGSVVISTTEAGFSFECETFGLGY